MTISNVARSNHRAVGVAELALTAFLGLATLAMCALMTGCSLTHVEARPAPAVGRIAVLGVESGFSLSAETKTRLSERLCASLGANGHVITGAMDASAHVVALVQRDFHSATVTSSMHTATDYEYGTLRVRLIVLDLDGKQIGEVHTERDVFISEMEQHPEREEQMLAEGIRRAANALFAAPSSQALGVLQARR